MIGFFRINPLILNCNVGIVRYFTVNPGLLIPKSQLNVKYKLILTQCRMQDISWIFQGGEATLKFCDFGYTYMSRAAKLRAVARGVWGHATRIFFKWCNFV